jgi:nitroreductase
MVIRIALLPPLTSYAWSLIKTEVLGGLAEGLIDHLALARVFESRDPPGLGHAKRWEAARIWLLEKRRADARSETQDLIARLAAPVRSLDAGVLVHTVALGNLLPAAREVGADSVWTATFEAAATLFGDRSAVDEALIAGASEARSPAFGAMVSLLGMGLLNALAYAKADDNLARRDSRKRPLATAATRA